MKIKSFLILPLTAMLLSCNAEDVLSIQIVNAINGEPNSKCEAKASDAQKFKGSLNFSIPEAMGMYPQYYLALKVKSSLETEKPTAGGTTLQPESRNDFYISELRLDYECQDEANRCRGFPNIPTQVTPMAGTVPAGGTLAVVAALFTVASADSIAAFVGEEGVNVSINIKLKGQFANGSEKEVPAYAFPLFLYRYALPSFDRNKYQLSAAEGSDGPACGNWGQDGAAPVLVCRPGCGGCGEGLKCDEDTCSCVSE